MLTAQQRYRQAMAKARILGRRQIREMIAGQRDYVESDMGRERAFLIAEIERAYQAGRRDGELLGRSE